MTRSVSSLHNTSTSPNSSEGRETAANGPTSSYGGLERRRSNMTASIRDLHQLSNNDLTANGDVFEESNTMLGNDSANAGFDASAGSAGPPSGGYYSATLPKNLRKGAVQKRVCWESVWDWEMWFCGTENVTCFL